MLVKRTPFIVYVNSASYKYTQVKSLPDLIKMTRTPSKLTVLEE